MKDVNSILIEEKDNVVVVVEEIKTDQVIQYIDKKNKIKSIKVLNDIPMYHKVSITNIDENDPIIKYGEHIGFAQKKIKIGEHVHTHNCEGRRENLKDIE